MAQKQQMFCLFLFASRTFRALGLKGLDPGSSFPGIDKTNLALWRTLGYVSDPVFRVHLFMCFLFCGVGRTKIGSHPCLQGVILHPDTTHTYSGTFIIIPVNILHMNLLNGPGCYLF